MGDYNRIMGDLETLGTRPGCTVLSIGAVFFSASQPEWKGPTFYAPLNRADCKKAGLHEDPDTLAWWDRQGPNAKKVFEEAELAPPLEFTLNAFSKWVKAHAAGAPQLWGNGADFDNPILSAVYKAAGLPQPWGAYDGRCYRTLKSLCPSEKIVRTGVHHNALDDALSQAEHAVRILKRLKTA